MRKQTSDWGWWAGWTDERFEVGPEATREDIIKEANHYGFDEGFHIVRARKLPIKIEHYFDVQDWLVQLEEGPMYDFKDPDGNGDPVLDLTEEQIKDLGDTVRRAILTWRIVNNIKIYPWIFTQTTDAEYIELHPEEG